MKNNDELKDELDNSPFLKKMKEQPGEGFKVPKNYFKHLPDEVMRKAKQPEFATAPLPTWVERLEQFVVGLFQPRYALAFAAVLALVVAGVHFFGKNEGEAMQPIASVQLSDISDDELFAYVSENIHDFDHDLVAAATGSELPEVKPKAKPSLPKTSAPKPELEEMEEYLDEVIDEVDVEDLEDLL